MKRELLLVAALFSAFLIGGCGEKVEVPPAHVGKVLTSNGYEPETIPPSKFRLPKCWFYCDKLIVAQIADVGLEESFQLFMPKDQLNMNFDLRGTFAIKSDEASIDQIFDRVISTPVDDGRFHSIITFNAVYDVYGKQVLRNVVRNVLSKYTINDIASNREVVDAAVTEAVNLGLEGTPIGAIRVGLADVQFPKVIVEAKEAAKQREVDIQRARADFEVKKVELEKELEQERMLRNIGKERASNIAEQNKILGASVTSDYIAYRQLEVLEEMAKAGNAFVVPMEALDSIGLQQKIFNTKVNNEN